MDVGVGVEWGNWSTLFGELEQAKEQASGSDGMLWRTVGGLPLLMLPAGRPNFRFHLQSAKAHLYIGKDAKPNGHTPNAMISVNAVALWCDGPLLTYRRLRSVIRDLGGKVTWIKPSRLDLCADFLIPGGLTESFIKTHVVCDSRKSNTHTESDALETIYFGASGNPLRLRIYDKTKELQKSRHKAWFHEIWKTQTTDEVWRVEFQLRRDVLRLFNINTPKELRAKAAGLWDLCTTWFELRLPDDSNTTRRTIHPFWAEVQSLKPRFGPDNPLGPKVIIRTPPALQRNLGTIVGYLLTFGAIRGHDSWAMLLKDFLQRIGARCSPKQYEMELQRRRIKLGTDGLINKPSYPPSWNMAPEGPGHE